MRVLVSYDLPLRDERAEVFTGKPDHLGRKIGNELAIILAEARDRPRDRYSSTRVTVEVVDPREIV